MNKNIYQIKIENFYEDHKRMPSYSEMMKIFGFKSKNAVFKIINKMVEEGIVSKDPLGRLMPIQKSFQVPMLGFVTAGLPASVEEEMTDSVDLNNLLINNKNFTYMLEVDGDSMIDAHIEKGDMVLVEKKDKAEDGDIIIAEVDGEFTMKYFRKKDNQVWLEPANKKYKPIYPRYDLKINAVVRAVIRKLK